MGTGVTKGVTGETEGRNAIIELTKCQMAEALELARQTHEIWRNERGYYNNTLRSHFIGRLGELAAEALLSSVSGLLVTPFFRNVKDSRLCDISVSHALGGTTRIEVKTWSNDHWNSLGRCISVRQLPDLKDKCDAIVWGRLFGRVPSEEEVRSSQGAVRIEIGSWSTIDDVEATRPSFTGVPGRRQVHNHQVSLDALRTWTSLSNRLRSAP